MSATICAFILTFSTLCGSRVVSGVLSGPTNVSLTSYNMDLVLRWDPPEGAPSGLLYTTEYYTPVTQSKLGCVDISALKCDFTSLNLSISEHGKYTGRVWAQLGQERSAWVESNEVTLDKETIIGSPNVTLFSNGATIEVSIKDPVFKISAFRNIFKFATYSITYWKDGQNGKAKTIKDILQNRVVLTDLDLWTTYCVQVQIETVRNLNNKPSRAVCERTTKKEEAPWVAALVTFVFLAVVVTLVVVAVVYRKSISHFLCPKDALPQYLVAPPNSSVYTAIRNSHPPEEFYDQVCIVADDQTVEEGCPPEAAGTNRSKETDISVG
nr:cytokine receptor family B4 [Larimichthys crocea]